MEDNFQLIDNIIKSRLLSFNDEGYGKILEIDVDSFRKRYRDVADEKLESFLEKFNEKFKSLDAFGSEYMIQAYIQASDVFNSLDFDWGENKQMVSRKKFCKWMFKQAYINNPHLLTDSDSPRTKDHELLSRFKPDPSSSKEDIDIVFTLLLTYNVIRPYGSDCEKALKYSSPYKTRDNMFRLLEELQEYLPTFGISKSLYTIKQALDILDDSEIEVDQLPPAALWGMLNNVSLELQSSSSPAELLDSHSEPDGYLMEGIWIDDCNDNQKRFWIFPQNKLMAFCFYYKNREWILNPYEFVFTKSENEYDFDQTCALITARGNEQVMVNGKINDEEIARLFYQLEDYDDVGRFQTMSFVPESGSEYPDWMNWQCFKRLPLDHILTKEYMEILDKIFHQSEMLHDFYYRNIGSVMTDSHDCLVGLDSEFLYLSDIALKKGGFLEKISAPDDYALYTYYIQYANKNPCLNLMNLEISEDQPMYVVARDPIFYEELDKSLNRKSLAKVIQNPEERKALLRRYEDFKETVMSTEFKNQVTIYKDLPYGSAPILCFNVISRTFIIDEIMEWFGVRKFTSREQMINSDLFTWSQRLS